MARKFLVPVGLADTDASHSLLLTAGSDLTADRTFTISTGDANRTLTIGASNLISTGNLGSSGTPDATTFLRGDQTWATPAGGLPGAGVPFDHYSFVENSDPFGSF